MRLNLAEEITLLSFDDKTGRAVSGYSACTVRAAILAELELLGRIEIGEDGIVVKDASALDDGVLNESLGVVLEGSKDIGTLIMQGLADHAETRILDRLVRLGILERVEKKALGLFPYQRYPQHDGKVEDEIRRRLRAAAAGDEDADQRTLVLLAIAHNQKLTCQFLSREECEQAEARLAELEKTNPYCQAITAAISAATTVAVIAATA